ncbi:hypothetical protein R3P38DRAFT_3575169 [Favolaschia claudopus]|uniref:CxC5 like cysteine cluster associated with KDZ domain-containing protein n=1 Tax=Favolaschia claudopus TaxID=2862362 RepID=A0AAW0ALK3_9AGAR
MSLQDIVSALQRFPGLSALNFHGLTQFLRYSCMARENVAFRQVNSRRPPPVLPVDIATTLASALNVADIQLIQTCWAAFKELLWDHPAITASSDEIYTYNKAALINSTSYRHIYPPVRACTNPHCSHYRNNHETLTLTDPSTHKATLHTRDHGALPVYTTSLSCRKCHRRYYNDHYVSHESRLRVYYTGVPDVLQVAKHFFIESALLEVFANGMVFGWISASNWARIYECALAEPNPHMRNNRLAFSASHAVLTSLKSIAADWNLEMRDEDVLNGFYLYSLLLDRAEHQGILVLPDDESRQRDRLQPALAERNKAMEGTGQEHWAHACDLCFIVFEDDAGNLLKMQSAHCDGDTIGHRCCKVHDCKAPLPSNRDHHCSKHTHLALECAVVECTAKVVAGHRTCADSAHRALETAYFSRGKALFQLRSRLKKAGVAVPNDSLLPGDNVEDDDEVIIEASCDGKAEAGNRTLRAYFGARRTHNEQLIMRSCGVILARATLFGSESVSAEFAKRVFPTPESTPEFFVFDNNCQLDKHQRSTKDTHFKNTGKPVDVFHFKCKHKLTDLHCQRYCNPAAFPEFICDGKWRFNTSICEQTNVWFGGFISIVQDMEVTRYNFYLDEMIKRRNRYIVAQLEGKGHFPWTIPRQTLFPKLV